jgi:hypothetical protein
VGTQAPSTISPGLGPAKKNSYPCEPMGRAVESGMKSHEASKTSAVFVIDSTFDEPMEYPQGAKLLIVRCLQAHHVVGSEIRA